jgi:membrane-associated phospholipid phosphatase
VVFLTDFADQAVVLPLVLVIAIGLWRGGWGRGALAWSLVCALTLWLVGLAKLAVFIWGPPASVPLLLSPSGHAAAAAVVYGGLFGLLGWHRLLLPAAALFCVAIGYTRIVLGEHTLADVVTGGAIGLAGAVALAFAAGPRPPDVSRRESCGLGVAVLLGFHGLRLPAEPWLRHFADVLAGR